MTKLCPVILNNEAVTVVKFNNIEVQLPSIHKDVKNIYVKYDNDRYAIVENIEEYEKKEVVISHKKRNQKKTTVENITVAETEETVIDAE